MIDEKLKKKTVDKYNAHINRFIKKRIKTFYLIIILSYNWNLKKPRESNLKQKN